jgi:hypothetical protein
MGKAAKEVPVKHAYARTMIGLAKLIVGTVAGIMVALALWLLVTIITVAG